MAKIRLFLIEDNRILREGIVAAVKAHRSLAVAGVSNGSDNALRRVRESKPHVVLMDLGLYSQNSLEIVYDLKKELPQIKVIGMGLAPTQSDILEFVQAGAEGFILKNATMNDTVMTILGVAEGRRILPPPMTGTLLSQVAAYAISRGRRKVRSAVRMTHREKEVIALIVEGMSNKQIATRLNIATFTVKSHVHNILEKLALHSRLEIAQQAQGDELF